MTPERAAQVLSGVYKNPNRKNRKRRFLFLNRDLTALRRRFERGEILTAAEHHRLKSENGKRRYECFRAARAALRALHESPLPSAAGRYFGWGHSCPIPDLRSISFDQAIRLVAEWIDQTNVQKKLQALAPPPSLVMVKGEIDHLSGVRFFPS